MRAFVTTPTRRLQPCRFRRAALSACALIEVCVRIDRPSHHPRADKGTTASTLSCKGIPPQTARVCRFDGRGVILNGITLTARVEQVPVLSKSGYGVGDRRTTDTRSPDQAPRRRGNEKDD
jgi:hypothetical protein